MYFRQLTKWIQQLVAIVLFMDKLGQITVEGSFNVTVNCQVDQHLLAKNFATIINALKELQTAQQRSDAAIKDLSSLKDKVQSLSQKVEKIQKSNNNPAKDPSAGSNQPASSGDISNSNLETINKRLDKNESNILDNIKDINLINKQVADAKKDIEDLKNRLAHTGNSQSDKNKTQGYGVEEVAQNMSKELHQTAQRMKDLQVRLLSAEEHIKKLDEELKKLQNNQGHNSQNQSNVASSSRGDKDVEELRKDLRDKLDVINKKLNNLQSETDHHDQQIGYLKDILSQTDRNSEGVQAEETNGEGFKTDLSDLRKRIEEVSDREKKDVKNLQDEIANLKLQLKSLKDQRIESKTSIEDQPKDKSNRKSTVEKNDLSDKLNDLILKVNYLEKLISGSKNSIGEDKNDKLPAINRPKRRDPNLTSFPDKEKSGFGRKELSELKADLEAFIRSLLDQNKDRENVEDLYLKIQQLRRALEKKADAEGTKKGFTFLENKITQLYLFLTEPETEDAMIVRKGFNCLSCSKRVEKLRGKLGPRLNWNNMTTTNYSPPRVGYSKPMGENSGDKQDDL